ncbi:glycosyltransferase family 2 protein [Patescibacteria group bacterium]|nr:glycosyltransferase family 2 protein [Patescibacteria group bacterium]
MDLSIITITWNSADKITEQIRSVISACQDISYEHIIVDNNSSDNTVELIKKDFPDVKLIENKENAGFGAANNQGVEISSGEFILFLNPDMRVNGELKKMLGWMKEKKDIGIASCKLVDTNGKFVECAGPRRFPKVWEMVVMILKLHHLFPTLLNNYLMKDFDENAEQEVDSVRGSFMLVRRELIDKLGRAFDHRYFIWWEDVDLCREAKRLGYKVMYTPIITCIDYVGQSFKKRNTIWKQKHFYKSLWQYFAKWSLNKK